MARPFKQRLDYFPFDIGFFNDERIRDLFVEHGFLVHSVYLMCLTLIYANGYYLECSIDSLAKRIFRELRCPWLKKVERVQVVINGCADCGLLDKSLMSQHVITSVSIQKTFMLAVRKRKNIDTSKYWLLSEDQMEDIDNFLAITSDREILPKIINDVSNSVNGGINSVNDTNNQQKKKENKKIKDKYDKRTLSFNKRDFQQPKCHFLTQALIESGYISSSSLDILRFNSLFEELVYSYGFELALSVTNYIIKYVKHSNVIIDDRYDYFKSSALKNSEILKSKNEKGVIDYERELECLLRRMG